jgi:hypothetical protein
MIILVYCKLRRKNTFYIDPYCVVFYGYNTLAKGVSIINELKNGMNNFRLTKNSMFDSYKIHNILSVNPKVYSILCTPTPYEILNKIRYIRGTERLVPERLGFFFYR